MNLVCPICSEQIVPSDQVHITPCGHMFHHTCLLQWLERSKTCPQCRNRCTEVKLIKVYFNVTANLDTIEDSASLTEKLNNLMLKLRQQQYELNRFKIKAMVHKREQKKMRKILEGLEEELRARYAATYAYEHEIEKLKRKTKALVQGVVDVQEVKERLKTELEEERRERKPFITNNVLVEAFKNVAIHAAIFASLGYVWVHLGQLIDW